MDLNVESLDLIENIIKETPPKIIGLSAFSHNAPQMGALISKLKQKCPETTFVAGGPHVSFTYKAYLKKYPLDFVVRFEGEESFLMLCKTILRGDRTYRHIPNLAYLDGPDCVVTSVKKEDDLDSLAFPVLSPEKYDNPSIPLLTSRGCSFDCIYGTASKYFGKTLRFRSENDIRQEIQQRAQQGHTSFMLYDDNLNVNRKHCESVCRIAKEEGIQFSANLSFSFLSEELADTLIRSGCKFVSIGVETADPEVQKKTGKVFDLEHGLNMVEYFCKNGVSVMCGIILFHYCDTKESIQRTIDYADKLNQRGALLRVNLNSALVGTTQFKKKEDLGLTLLQNQSDLFGFNHASLETKEFDKDFINHWFKKFQISDSFIERYYKDLIREGEISIDFEAFKSQFKS